MRFASIILLIFFLSCKNNNGNKHESSNNSTNLSRSQAAAIIKEKLQFPKMTKACVPKIHHVYNNYGENDEMMPLLTKMQDNGLIILSNREQGMGENYNVALTSEGQKYLVSTDEDCYYVRLFNVDFDAVTGIVEFEQPKKYASVEYSTKRVDQTPFNDFARSAGNSIYLNYLGSMAQSDHFEENQTINIIKYDDGWRVEAPTSKQ